MCDIFYICKEVHWGFLYVYIFYYLTGFEVSDSIITYLSYFQMSPKHTPPNQYIYQIMISYE